MSSVHHSARLISWTLVLCLACSNCLATSLQGVSSILAPLPAPFFYLTCLGIIASNWEVTRQNPLDFCFFTHTLSRLKREWVGGEGSGVQDQPHSNSEFKASLRCMHSCLKTIKKLLVRLLVSKVSKTLFLPLTVDSGVQKSLYPRNDFSLNAIQQHILA